MNEYPLCQMYLHEHHKPMSTPAVAQLIVTMLYHKRFFPYYISNILAGLDEEGKCAPLTCRFQWHTLPHSQASISRGNIFEDCQPSVAGIFDIVKDKENC